MDILCGNYGDYDATFSQVQFGDSANFRDMFGQATGTATHLRVYNLDAGRDLYFGVWNEAGDTLLATAEGVDMPVGINELPLSTTVNVTSDQKFQFKFRADDYWDVGQMAPDAATQSWKLQAYSFASGQWTQAAIGSQSGSTAERRAVICLIGTRTGPTLSNVTVDSASTTSVTATMTTDDATGTVAAIIGSLTNATGADAWSISAGNNVLGSAAIASITAQSVGSTSITLNFTGLSLADGDYRLRVVQTSATNGYSDMPTVDFTVSGGATAAVISGLNVTTANASTLTASLTTDQNSGTLYYVIDETANMSGINAAQIIAGNNANDAAPAEAGSTAVSTTSPSVNDTGLTLGSGNYTVAFAQTNTNGLSNVVSDTFSISDTGFLLQDAYAPNTESPIGDYSDWNISVFDKLPTTGDAGTVLYSTASGTSAGGDILVAAAGLGSIGDWVWFNIYRGTQSNYTSHCGWIQLIDTTGI